MDMVDMIIYIHPTTARDWIQGPNGCLKFLTIWDRSEP